MPHLDIIYGQYYPSKTLDLHFYLDLINLSKNDDKKLIQKYKELLKKSVAITHDVDHPLSQMIMASIGN